MNTIELFKLHNPDAKSYEFHALSAKYDFPLIFFNHPDEYIRKRDESIRIKNIELINENIIRNSKIL